MEYDDFINAIKDKLQDTLAQVPEHDLDQKYLASATRDYAESLRALEQARLNSRKGV